MSSTDRPAHAASPAPAAPQWSSGSPSGGEVTAAHVLRSVLGAWLVLAVATTVVRLGGLDRVSPLVLLVTVYPHVVAGSVLALLGTVVLRWRAAALVAVLVVGTGVTVLAPRVVADDQPTVDGPVVTVAVANILYGNGDPDAVVAAVDDLAVDVLVVLELTADGLAGLRAAGLEQRLAPATVTTGRFASGTGVWTSQPASVVDPRSDRRTTPIVRLAVPGTLPVVLAAPHPVPPVGSRAARSWAATLAALPGPAPDVLHVVAGDLNATLDHRALRSVLARGYVDAAAAVGAGLATTYSGIGHGELVPPITIDHVLVDRRIRVEDVVVRDIPRSDHEMVVARLRLPSR